MGKTSKPLNILVDKRLTPSPTVEGWIEKGHNVVISEAFEHYDGAISQRAWQADAVILEKHGDLMLKAMREERYGGTLPDQAKGAKKGTQGRGRRAAKAAGAQRGATGETADRGGDDGGTA